MRISIKQEGTILTLALEGELSTPTAPQLEEALPPGMKGVDQLILDASELLYLSSAGLRIILKARQELEGRGGVTVRNASKELMDIFEVTGFDDLLTFE